MPALSQQVLHGTLFSGLPDSASAVGTSNETRPVEIDIDRVGRYRIYLWTLTNIESRTGARRPDEFKIQLILPGQRARQRGALDLSAPATTVLLGYSPDYGVFVSWQASLHANFGFSSTVQVREALLQDAYGYGWAVGSPREVEAGSEVSVAFTHGNLLHYLTLEKKAQSNGLTGVSREALFLSGTPNTGTLPVPQQGTPLDEYIKKQREKILVGRLSRDAGFGKRVKIEYGYACAVCGLQLEIIEGAHIIPITEDTSEDAIWNGIALCPNHHKLFDSLAFAVDPMFKFCVNHARIEFLRSSGRAEGAEREVLKYENQPVQKPRFFTRSLRDRDKLLFALKQHKKRAIV